MPKVIIYLQETEFAALQRLAQQEYRTTKAQAALIIREELARVKLITTETEECNEVKIDQHPKVGSI